MEFSIVHYYGKQENKCGYCKGTKSSMSHGMHAYYLSPKDYQELIDRGWRRSGNYCYKPINKITCCPCYTIKCNVLDFKPSKSHKKILKRMNRFLRDGKKDKYEEQLQAANMATETAGAVGEDGGSIREEPQEPDVPLLEVDVAAVAAANPTRYAVSMQCNEHSDDQLQAAPQQQQTSNENIADIATPLQSTPSSLNSEQISLDTTRPPCKKAKQMRIERREAKLAVKGATVAPKAQQQNQEKTLQEYFSEANPTDKHKLKIVMLACNKQSVTDEAFNLYRKYQLLIHNDDPQRLSPAGLKRFCYKSPLQSKQFKNTLSSSYAVYQKYQTRIHNDPPDDVKDYLNFLQHSPLEYKKSHDGPSTGYGSFHHQYWLDDKLIAVGVIDVLPYCVSSVYFFYDPDYSFLSLGTYGSLREIAYVQELAAKVPALKYYYMGFYIHSCPKMRYKGRLVPSQLLCPEAYSWHLLTDDIRAKLHDHKYQRFNPDLNTKDVNEFLESHLDAVLLLMDNNAITYRQYIQSFNIETIDNMLDSIRSRIYKQITGEHDNRGEISEYGKLVGKTCAHRMLYLIV